MSRLVDSLYTRHICSILALLLPLSSSFALHRMDGLIILFPLILLSHSPAFAHTLPYDPRSHISTPLLLPSLLTYYRSLPSLRPLDAGNALYSLHSMDGEAPEVRAVLGALAHKIVVSSQALSGLDIGMSLFGLRSMDAEIPEVWQSESSRIVMAPLSFPHLSSPSLTSLHLSSPALSPPLTHPLPPLAP